MKRFFFNILTLIMICSCQKETIALKEELTGENAVFVGTWDWKYTEHDYGFCDGEFWQEQITSDAYGTDFRLIFVEKGIVYFLKNDSLISEFRVKFESFNPDDGYCSINNASTFNIDLDGREGLYFNGCVNSDTIRLGSFPGFLFNAVEGCETYRNYFVRK